MKRTAAEDTAAADTKAMSPAIRIRTAVDTGGTADTAPDMAVMGTRIRTAGPMLAIRTRTQAGAAATSRITTRMRPAMNPTIRTGMVTAVIRDTIRTRVVVTRFITIRTARTAPRAIRIRTAATRVTATN